MRLSTSTGDFSGYFDSVSDRVKCFKDSKFKYINLELCRTEFLSAEDSEDGWKRLAETYGESAAYAGVTYVVSHSPSFNPYASLTDEHYGYAVRQIKSAIEICNVLGIKGIVVHAGENAAFTTRDFYEKNKKFYLDLAGLAENYGITVMTENMVYYDYCPLSTGKEMGEFIDFVDHPLVSGCWDTAHANNNKKAKDDGQYKCITDLGKRLKGLHIADNFGDGLHQHTWPFAGNINFDEIMQGLVDAEYDGYFNFEASYTLIHQVNCPNTRKPWVHNGETVTRLMNPSVDLKKTAVNLLYDTGRYILSTYDCFEE